eukprot:3046601-Pleurochrysis_carterae.AAC.5
MTSTMRRSGGRLKEFWFPLGKLKPHGQRAHRTRQRALPLAKPLTTNAVALPKTSYDQFDDGRCRGKVRAWTTTQEFEGHRRINGFYSSSSQYPHECRSSSL